ncbi:MAG TPA: methyl-accepting chemotaxis protein [Myxococcota bacterium]|nr:methyl-accepting chemotaxis protein [Myxococcota bacterium]
MDAVQLPSGRTFARGVRLVEVGLIVPAIVILFFYLNGVLAFSSSDWRVFGSSLGAYVAAIVLVAEFQRRAWWNPIQSYLDAPQPARTLPAARDAFKATMALPRRFLQFHLAAWGGAGLFGTVGMALWSGRDWGAFEHATTFVAGLTGGLVAGALAFFGLRRYCGPLRAALAGELPDPRDRRALLHPFPLRAKLMLTVTSSGLASVVFAALLAYARASGGMIEVIGVFQDRVLKSAIATSSPRAGSALPGPGPLDARDAAFEQPVEVVRLDVDAPAESVPPELGEALVREIKHQMAEGMDSGTLRHEETILRWRRHPQGHALVAITPMAGLQADLWGLAGTLSAFLGMAAAVSAGLVLLFAGDVGQATGALGEAAQRMSQGDLRPRHDFESDDELGQLARTYEQTCGSLRTLIGDVSQAAQRVDSAAGELSSVSQGMATTAGDQAREMDRVHRAVEQIHQQVQDLSGAAEHLNGSMEEAGSSIVELGATGEQLRETAGTLSGQVDDVLGSIEEVIRSSQRVAESSETLSEAASETSGNMEEMASAMKTVDVTAEKMAQLADAVQQSADAGRLRVSETIEGMRDIQRATETAGRVVRRLVEAAKEIGAILGVISDVADETNLLALNAAIIAAQSGDNGRAFSVVADQIRELAERVLASTNQIASMIHALQEESGNAVGAIDQGTRSVLAGVERSAQAGLSLEEITRAARESASCTTQIVSAVREQTKAAAHVVGLMGRVIDGVEQIRAAEGDRGRGSEAITRSAAVMREVAQQVRGTTQEQARGYASIREMAERVRETTRRMNSALREQTVACKEVASFLERVLQGTRESDEAAQQMGHTVQSLVGEAEALRGATRRFEL